MSKKNERQRLIAEDETVTLKNVKLGTRFFFTVVFDLSVEQFKGRTFLVGRNSKGEVVRIMYSQITCQVCPKGLTQLERDLWERVRTEFAKELDELEADTWSAQYESRIKRVLLMVEALQPPRGDKVILPSKSGANTSVLPSRQSHLRLVTTGQRVETSVEVGTATQSAGDTLAERLPRLTVRHLTAWDKTARLLQWPSPVGMVQVSRIKVNEGEYWLTLEQVPVGHPLHRLFTKESREGRKVSVQVGLEGLVISTLLDPSPSEKYFAQCLEELGREPGQQKVV